MSILRFYSLLISGMNIVRWRCSIEAIKGVDDLSIACKKNSINTGFVIESKKIVVFLSQYINVRPRIEYMNINYDLLISF